MNISSIRISKMWSKIVVWEVLGISLAFMKKCHTTKLMYWLLQGNKVQVSQILNSKKHLYLPCKIYWYLHGKCWTFWIPLIQNIHIFQALKTPQQNETPQNHHLLCTQHCFTSSLLICFLYFISCLLSPLTKALTNYAWWKELFSK